MSLRPIAARAPKRGAVFALGLALTLMPGTVLQAQERGELGIAVGATASPVVIEDLDGNPVDLADYIGKGPLVIEFWASWCENCEAIKPGIDAAHATYGDRVNFLGVAVAVAQSTRRVRRHLEEHPSPFPFLWDDGGRAVRAFLAPATSYVVALDANGVVTYTGIGPDQDLDQAARSALGSD